MYYFMEMQKAAKQKIGDNAKVDVTATTREISAKWKSFSDPEKEKYVKMHEADKARFDK